MIHTLTEFELIVSLLVLNNNYDYFSHCRSKNNPVTLLLSVLYISYISTKFLTINIVKYQKFT